MSPITIRTSTNLLIIAFHPKQQIIMKVKDKKDLGCNAGAHSMRTAIGRKGKVDDEAQGI
jgi:hypothetical protein